MLSLSMKHIASILPWILIVALCITNALLVTRNIRLRTELTKFMPETLARNERVTPFSAPGLDGGTVDVTYSINNGRKRVLMYFAPSCVYSRDQSAIWRDIIAHANEGGYEVLGVVKNDENKPRLEEYLRSFGLEKLRIALLPIEVLKSYKLRYTPTTVIVNSDGTVDRVWVGKHTDITIN
jgi:hypothetical protein